LATQRRQPVANDQQAGAPLPFGFEHDDRALLDRHALGLARFAQDFADRYKRRPFRAVDARLVRCVAELKLQLRHRLRMIERDQRAAVADRHEFKPPQTFQRSDGHHDDDRVVAVTRQFGRANHGRTPRRTALGEGYDRPPEVGVNGDQPRNHILRQRHSHRA
jgi:hypothetical protein